MALPLTRKPFCSLFELWVGFSITVALCSLVLIYNTLGGTGPADDQLRGAWDTPRHWATVIEYCGAPASGEEGAGGAIQTWVAKNGAVASGGARLLGLQVLIRHGDRSSIHWLTQDPPPFSCAFTDEDAIKAVEAGFKRYHVLGAQGKAKPDDLMPRVVHSEDHTQERCFPGQLTERGLLQHLATGRYLRSRYEDIMDWGAMAADPKKIYIRTTHYPRTFQSGGALMLGLLPEKIHGRLTVHTQEDNNLEPLFGVGLHGSSRDRSKDPLHVPERGFCQRAVELAAAQEKAYVSTTGVDILLAKLFPSVPKVADLSLTDQADPLMAVTCSHLSLPCDTSGPACPSRKTVLLAKQDADQQYCLRYLGLKGGREATRLAMQPILAEIVNRFVDMTTDKSPVRFALLSAHDTVVAPLVAALEGFDCRWPPYASRVVFELWESQSGFYTRIMYNGRTITSVPIHCSNTQSEPAPGLIPLQCFQSYVTGLLGGADNIEEACARA